MSCPKFIKGICFLKNDIELILDKVYILQFMKYTYYNTYLQFKTLTDLIVIDYPGRDLRFNLIYNLLSIHYNIRMFVLIFVDELSFNYSLTSIFFGIN